MANRGKGEEVRRDDSILKGAITVVALSPFVDWLKGKQFPPIKSSALRDSPPFLVHCKKKEGPHS
jgi:hypothetical protein